MKIKSLLGALVVALALVVCGCGNAGGNSTFEDKQVDPNEVAKATPVVDSWVDSAFSYFDSHKDEWDKGVVMQVTGMITKGSASGKESMLTLIGPDDMPESSDDAAPREPDAIVEIKVTDGMKRIDVYFDQPVEMTKWTHLTSVKGMAFMDSPNHIVMRGAREVED